MSSKEETSAQLISRAINRLGHWEEETAKELANDHPTLQQTFMRLCVFYIKEQAQKDLNRTDLRNEATVKLAKRIMPALADGYEYLPLV